MKLRPANTRGVMKKSWITSLRTFSNNDYWNPRYMNWHCLKVINDDTQQPGGFVPNHEHKNYDILGYVVQGELEHTDSLGNINRARAGQIQHMWCGSSIWHTERCIGNTPARYLQLWITPNRDLNSEPYYEIINKGPEFGPILVDLKQDITVKGGILTEDYTVSNAYLYVVSGSCIVEGIALDEGDGAELNSLTTIVAQENCHILTFEI
jgi:redox-sensitive bicupin YhaK (pirin superfamily)